MSGGIIGLPRRRFDLLLLDVNWKLQFFWLKAHPKIDVGCLVPNYPIHFEHGYVISPGYYEGLQLTG